MLETFLLKITSKSQKLPRFTPQWLYRGGGASQEDKILWVYTSLQDQTTAQAHKRLSVTGSKLQLISAKTRNLYLSKITEC